MTSVRRGKPKRKRRATKMEKAWCKTMKKIRAQWMKRNAPGDVSDLFPGLSLTDVWETTTCFHVPSSEEIKSMFCRRLK